MFQTVQIKTFTVASWRGKIPVVNPKTLALRGVIWIVALFCAPCFASAHPLDNWHNRYTNSAGILWGVTFGEGKFVAVGDGGTVVTSETGLTWSPQSSGTTQSLRSVVWGDGAFVAVGDAGTILSSEDGTNWTTRICPGISGTLWKIIYGQGRFVTIAGSTLAVTSTNGTNWTANPAGTSLDGTCLASGHGLFLVESSSKTNSASLNGTNWFPLLSGSQKSLYTMTFANGTFVALDHDLNSFTSTDGTNWVKRGSINSANLIRPAQIAYGSGHFVTVGGGFIHYTRDATTWTVSTNGYFYVGWSVAYGQGTFVVVNNRIIQSDPVVWLDSTGPGNFQISAVPGLSCLIETTSTPNVAASWSPFATVPITTCPQPWTDPAPPITNRFYRATLLP